MAQLQDPLIAALPPATDYITYLTLLEYQLNSGNLGTLNRLLSEDDGKLAEEIGWDLLRLVLPMLRDIPKTVVECFDILARRGNPREIVIRVAEELEKLGRTPADDDDDDAPDSAEKNEDDGLSTFAGEAERVHLGAMKLDGMPDDGKTETDLPKGASPYLNQDHDGLSFTALLDMLCTVQPRIKTRYPSRFLATSLPAALGAYRRLSSIHLPTSTFNLCLRQLWPDERPPLPPRDLNSVTAAPNLPMPDPEAATEATPDGDITVSDNERSIVTRLLQAVLLEVLEEYSSSLQTEDEPCMSWATRLREIARPDRIVPGKTSQSKRWDAQLELTSRDDVSVSIVATAHLFHMDTCALLKQAMHPEPSSTEAESDEEPSEYPTSPSQIPLAQTALVLLIAAQEFYDRSFQANLDSETIWKTFNALTPLSEAPNLPSPAVQDALHTILFWLLSSSPTVFQDRVQLTRLVAILTQTFTTNPFPQLRDDAHYLASRLLQGSTESQTKLHIIKQTLRGYTEAIDGENITKIPLSTPLNEGSLRAVGVDWLKNEFLSSVKASTLDATPGVLAPAVIDEDEELSRLLFFPISPIPKETESNNDIQEHVLLMLPFYISVLNLCCILLGGEASTSDSTRSKASTMLQSLSLWYTHLLDQMTKNDDVKHSATDIYALEDACQRLGAIINTQST